MGKPLCFAFLVAFGAMAGGANGSPGTGLFVQALSARCAHERLVVTWRVTNVGTRPVYVYSTFLNGPAAGFEENSQRVLNLHTSLKGKVDAGVNSYPEAKFTGLSPGESIHGTLQDRTLCSELPKPRAKALVMDVAYGYEVEGVKAALLRSSNDPNRHPANPIVDWRELAKSNPTPLR